MAKKKTIEIGTKEEFGVWFGTYITHTFGGNKSDAARHFKEERTIIGDVIAARRSPTKRILKALKGGKSSVPTFYVGAEF